MKTTFGRLVAGCAFALALALPVVADEPVWPADFAEKLAANRAAAQPGAGQSDTSGEGIILSSVRKWHEAFSQFVKLNTKKIKGIIIGFH